MISGFLRICKVVLFIGSISLIFCSPIFCATETHDIYRFSRCHNCSNTHCDFLLDKNTVHGQRPEGVPLLEEITRYCKKCDSWSQFVLIYHGHPSLRTSNDQNKLYYFPNKFYLDMYPDPSAASPFEAAQLYHLAASYSRSKDDLIARKGVALLDLSRRIYVANNRMRDAIYPAAVIAEYYDRIGNHEEALKGEIEFVRQHITVDDALIRKFILGISEKLSR